MESKAVKSEIIHPKQSNYDTYFIPKEVGHIRNVPLYRLVSYWGLQKKIMSVEMILQPLLASPYGKRLGLFLLSIESIKTLSAPSNALNQAKEILLKTIC